MAALLASSWGAAADVTDQCSPSGDEERAAASVPQEFSKWSLPDVGAYRTELLHALHELRAALAQLEPDAENAWLGYFRLVEVEQGLSLPSPQRIALLQMLGTRLRADIAGLETDEVLRLRSAAAAYQRQLELRSGNMPAEIRAAAGLLQTALGDERIPTQAESDRLGAAAALLNDVGYAPALVAAAHERWSRPNAVIHVGTTFASKFVERQVADVSMQSAVILGTSTRGPASTQGRLEFVSVPNDEVAQLQLRLTGATRSARNVGRNGPAVIYSSSISHFEGSKSLFVDPVWGVSSRAANVRVNASIGIKRIDIDSPRLPELFEPAVTRAAWSKAQQNQSAAEREVERLTSRRLEQRIEQEIADPLDQARDFFHESVFLRLLRLDDLPAITSRSAADSFEIVLCQRKHAQLAAVSPQPEFEPATQLGLAVHQSFFANNSSHPILCDSVQTDEMIESYSQFVAMTVPPALRVYSNSVPWSVTLKHGRPNTFTFDDGKIAVKIFIKAWTIGDRRFARDVDVNVVYRVENTSLGMKFTRVGDLTITTADGLPWTADEQAAMLPHMTEKLSALFQETGRFNSLCLPKGDGFGPFGLISLEQLQCDDGWLVIGYQ